MKRIRMISVTILLAMLVSSLNLFAQSPAQWDFKTKKINDSVAELILHCKLSGDWHIYSQKTKGTELPIEFKFEADNSYDRIGGVKEPSSIAEYDPYAKDTARYFKKDVTFRQRIKIKTKQNFQVKGSVYFQLCEKGSCIPPDEVEYVFSVKGNPNFATPVVAIEEEMVAVVGEGATETLTASQPNATKEETVQVQESETKVENAATKDKSMWGVFFVSFAAGLLALITPCVFPMIPMTVSFFMKGNSSKRKARQQAYFFGASIVFMFAVLGTVLTLLLGKDAMYIISTHWIPNLIFFVIFMIFAFSFFGLFEITISSKIINKSDEQADKGGYLGTFFIALTTVLVSFSCTGPILGAALIEMASGSSNSFVFLISMLGFAVGFALPFTLLAMFPSVLKNMKSGSWLNTVKIVFGFIEIALGLKFLSMADLSAGWGILDRETYLALWIVTFAMLGFYLLGKLKFKGDEPLEKIGVPRLFLALITFSFVIYMLPGMWGAPLKAISGYIPPQTTQDFDLIRINAENATAATSTSALPADRKYSKELHLPTGFEGFFDLEEAKAYAKQVGKPIFIDFTGKTCANCREMENYVWVDPQVKKRLNEDYVMVALYADVNNIELPESEWITTKDGKIIKTLGKKNHNFQIEQFNANAQPLYVLMDADGNLLTKEPKSYDRNIENFVKFLDEGLSNFNKTK
ncbi:MAG: cytochrome c biogenesis protein CcdA [Bacteroidales bacterium]|nr:cytochrome c biogenesis protein CcdA [Bacteroidales bacterium]